MNKIDVLNKIVKYLTRIHNDYDNNEYKQKFYQYSDLYTQINSNNFSKEQYGGALTDDLITEIDTAYNSFITNKSETNKTQLEDSIKKLSDMDPDVLFTALETKTKFGLNQLDELLKHFSNLFNKDTTTERFVETFNKRVGSLDIKFSTYAIIYILYSKQRLSNNFEEEFSKKIIEINNIIIDTNDFLRGKKQTIPKINGLDNFQSEINKILDKNIQEITDYQGFETMLSDLSGLLTDTKKLLLDLSNNMTKSLDENKKQNIINLNTYYYFLTGILDTLLTKKSMLELTKIKFDTLKTENDKNSKNLDNIFELIEYFKKYIETSKQFMKLKPSENLDLSQLVGQVNELTQNLSNLTSRPPNP